MQFSLHPAMSGYPLDLFIDQVSEDLICRICRKVLKFPRKTPCGHVFCLSCLSSWIEYYGVCPNRCGDVELIELTHAVDEDRRVCGMQKKCKYFQIGCKKHEKISEIEQHEKVCTYQHSESGTKPPAVQQPSKEDMRRTVAPSLDCLFGRLGKNKKRTTPSDKLGNIPTEGGGLMESEQTFRLKRNKTSESLGLVLVSGSKNSDGNAEYFSVKEVHPGTLAAKAGIYAGDRIVQIDGIELGRMNPGEAVARIKDKTLVTVTIVRGDPRPTPHGHSNKEHIYDEILYSDASQFTLSQPDESAAFGAMSLEPPEQRGQRHSPMGPRRTRVPLADDPYSGQLVGGTTALTTRFHERDYVHQQPEAIREQLHVEGSKDSGLSSSGSNDSARLVHRQLQKVADTQRAGGLGGSRQQQQQLQALSQSQGQLNKVAGGARHSYRTEREMMRGGGMQEGRSNSQGTLPGDEDAPVAHRRNCRVEGNYELQEIYIQKNGTNQLGITLGYGGGQLLVCNVVPGGLAAQDGRIKKGDIIRMVNGFSVFDPEEAILLFLEQDQDITLTVARKIQHQPTSDDRRNFRRIDSCGSLDSHTSESKQKVVSRKLSNNSEDCYIPMNGRGDLVAPRGRGDLVAPHGRGDLVAPHGGLPTTRKPKDPLPPTRRTGSEDPFPPTRRTGSEDPFPPTRRTGSEDPFPPTRRGGSDDPFPPPTRRTGSEDPFPPTRRGGSDDPLSPPTRRGSNDLLGPTRRDPPPSSGRALDDTPSQGLQQGHMHSSAFFRPIQDDYRSKNEHPLVYTSRQQSRPMTTTPPLKHKTSVQLSAPPSTLNGHIYGELEAPNYGFIRTESLV